MKNTRFILPLMFLTAIPGSAGELAVVPAPFTIGKTIHASVLPADGLQLVPAASQRWSDFVIRTIRSNGSRVAKGDILIEFEALSLDRKLDDTRRAITSKSLALEQAEQDLAHLSATREIRLEALRTTARIAREENEYFNKVDRDARARKADQELERAKQYLANQTEELRQLEKMYAADDMTEETEEIILTRQKNQVVAAQFALEMESLSHQRVRNVLLAREAEEKSDAERDASIALKEAEQSVPRAIELKKSEVESLKVELQRERDTLAELEHDHGLMKIQAPSAGWFFHGLIENGRWITGEILKPVVIGGRPSLSSPFATFVSDSAPLVLSAHVDGTVSRALTAKQKAVAAFPGREDITIPSMVESISPGPSPDGTHAIIIRADWPKDFAPAIGTTAEVRCVTYHKEQAITVPEKALTFGPEGFAVSVKLADGKTERRLVKRGRVSGETVEILEGLEDGQVVIVP